MKQNTPDILRLRTFIFPGEEQKAYVESKNGCYIPFLVTLAREVWPQLGQRLPGKIAFSCSLPARISKGQGAGPEKGLFSALLDFQKRHFL
jgi:hypothetical protein